MNDIAKYEIVTLLTWSGQRGCIINGIYKEIYQNTFMKCSVVYQRSNSHLYLKYTLYRYIILCIYK